mmetsp:Transcript_33007/g.54509  ORF Transcript_33007/g.54509 Transcript_33007/m.54509 type:complete len:248 (+) Transcript_33007:807-1550(+)
MVSSLSVHVSSHFPHVSSQMLYAFEGFPIAQYCCCSPGRVSNQRHGTSPMVLLILIGISVLSSQGSVSIGFGVGPPVVPVVPGELVVTSSSSGQSSQVSLQLSQAGLPGTHKSVLQKSLLNWIRTRTHSQVRPDSPLITKFTLLLSAQLSVQTPQVSSHTSRALGELFLKELVEEQRMSCLAGRARSQMQGCITPSSSMNFSNCLSSQISFVGTGVGAGVSEAVKAVELVPDWLPPTAIRLYSLKKR